MERKTLEDFRQDVLEANDPDKGIYFTVEPYDGQKTVYRDVIQAMAERNSEFGSGWAFIIRLKPQGTTAQRDLPGGKLSGWTGARLERALDLAVKKTPVGEYMPVIIVDADGKEVEFRESGWECGQHCAEECGDEADPTTCEVVYIFNRAEAA